MIDRSSLGVVSLTLIVLASLPAGAYSGASGSVSSATLDSEDNEVLDSLGCLPSPTLNEISMNAYRQEATNLQTKSGTVASNSTGPDDGQDMFRVESGSIAASTICFSGSEDDRESIELQLNDVEFEDTALIGPWTDVEFEQGEADSMTVVLSPEEVLNLLVQIPGSIDVIDTIVDLFGIDFDDDTESLITETDDETPDESDSTENDTMNGVDDTIENTTDQVDEITDNTTDGANDTIENTTDGANDTIDDTTGTVNDTVDDTTDAVNDTIDDTTDGTDDTVDNTTDAVDDTADNTTNVVDDTVDNTTDTINETVDDTPVDDPVNSTTDVVDDAVDDTTDVVDDVVDGTTDVIGGLAENTTNIITPTIDSAIG